MAAPDPLDVRVSASGKAGAVTLGVANLRDLRYGRA